MSEEKKLNDKAVENTDPTEPKTLSEAELAKVSGGKIPDLLVSYIDLIAKYRQGIFRTQIENGWDEAFLDSMYNAMWQTGHKKEASIVEYYRNNGRLPD